MGIDERSRHATSALPSGQWVVFVCRKRHVWVDRLPSWRELGWPNCPECGEKGYLREPLWHRGVTYAGQGAGVALAVYSIAVDHLANAGLLVAAIGLMFIRRMTCGRLV